MSTIALCVVTFRRPSGLGRLLDRIAALDLDGVDADVRVVVVDNDPEGSARSVVEASRTGTDLDLTYVVETHRGITYARNRALALALDTGTSADWIGWLDDDEAPRTDWLRRLIETQRETNADVVIGPSEPRFGDRADSWLIAAGAFDSPSFRTGQPYPYFYTRTSGVILRSCLVPAERFDNRLALTGGEDRVFFTRMHRSGATFVWDAGAIVDEWVPDSRVSVGWLGRRWFRIGVTRSLALLYLDSPSLPRRVRRVVGGLGMAARGLGEAALALPRGRGPAWMAARRMLLGLGSSYGALGLHYREYRTTDGS